MSGERKKRKAQETPEKDSPAADLIQKISERTQGRINDLKTLMGEAEAAKQVKDLKDVLVKYIKATVKHEEDTSNQLSDVFQMVSKLEKKTKAAEVKAEAADVMVKEIERARETVEIKASRREMAQKMEFATTQVKVMDLDFDKSIDEQKEMVRVAKVRLTAKMKPDDQPKFGELIKKAEGMCWPGARQSTR